MWCIVQDVRFDANAFESWYVDFIYMLYATGQLTLKTSDDSQRKQVNKRTMVIQFQKVWRGLSKDYPRYLSGKRPDVTGDFVTHRSTVSTIKIKIHTPTRTPWPTASYWRNALGGTHRIYGYLNPPVKIQTPCRRVTLKRCSPIPTTKRPVDLRDVSALFRSVLPTVVLERLSRVYMHYGNNLTQVITQGSLCRQMAHVDAM
jgi:hypothetical protein